MQPYVSIFIAVRFFWKPVNGEFAASVNVDMYEFIILSTWCLHVVKPRKTSFGEIALTVPTVFAQTSKPVPQRAAGGKCSLYFFISVNCILSDQEPLAFNVDTTVERDVLGSWSGVCTSGISTTETSSVWTSLASWTEIRTAGNYSRLGGTYGTIAIFFWVFFLCCLAIFMKLWLYLLKVDTSS